MVALKMDYCNVILFSLTEQMAIKIWTTCKRTKTKYFTQTNFILDGLRELQVERSKSGNSIVLIKWTQKWTITKLEFLDL